MTTVERMLAVAPIRLSLMPTGRYRCEWSFDHAHALHAVGEGLKPFEALVAAHAYAVKQGWIKP